jgi:hypothetical protein
MVTVIGMTEHVLDGLEVHPGCQSQGGRTVPQPVEGDRRQVGQPDQAAEFVSHVDRMKRTAVGFREEQIWIVPPRAQNAADRTLPRDEGRCERSSDRWGRRRG